MIIIITGLNIVSYSNKTKEEKLLVPGERGNSHMKRTDVLVVSFKGVNFGFWFHLGFSGVGI